MREEKKGFYSFANRLNVSEMSKLSLEKSEFAIAT